MKGLYSTTAGVLLLALLVLAVLVFTLGTPWTSMVASLQALARPASRCSRSVSA